MCRNRALVRPGAALFRALYDECRADLAQRQADLAQLHFKHQCALADLHRKFDACRVELDQLKDVIRRRVAAEQELRELYRERELMRALSAERDPALPLQ
jgi:hypothetical protein